MEFLRLGENRILLIIVTPEGDVQNRIITIDRPYTASQLTEAANFINQNFAGLDFEEMRKRLKADLRKLREDISQLMSHAVEAGSEAMQDRSGEFVLSGERHLLDVSDLSTNMDSLRRLFAMFEQKTGFLQLLELSSHAQGVKIFIGGESGLVPLDECSVVTAPYEVDGQVVGTVGVIGPTRMAYERVIPIVDITAKLLSSALSHRGRGDD